MLIQSTWTITPDTTAVLPRTYCLELIKQLQAKMGLTMGEEKIPSVTFSGIMGDCSGNQDFLSFAPEEFYQLSLAGLSEKSAKAIASLDLGESLEFLGAKFNITDRENNLTSYEQLYTLTVAEEPQAIRVFELDFLSPTAFNYQRLHLPLPVPNLMFRGWLEKWNNFASIYLGGEELIEYLSEGVKIKRHKIQTRNFQLEKGYITGFTGQVVLQVPSRFEPLLANVTNLLVQYSTWCGTGVKTRLGMGKTEVRSQKSEIRS